MDTHSSGILQKGAVVRRFSLLPAWTSYWTNGLVDWEAMSSCDVIVMTYTIHVEENTVKFLIKITCPYQGFLNNISSTKGSPLYTVIYINISIRVWNVSGFAHKMFKSSGSFLTLQGCRHISSNTGVTISWQIPWSFSIYALCKFLANERRRYTYNIFSHWLRTCSAIDKRRCP